MVLVDVAAASVLGLLLAGRLFSFLMVELELSVEAFPAVVPIDSSVVCAAAAAVAVATRERRFGNMELRFNPTSLSSTD